MMQMLQSLAMPETEQDTSIHMPMQGMVDGRKLDIVLVEDVNADAVLTGLTLKATGIPLTLSRIARGDEMLTRLELLCFFKGLPNPDLILLDLGLPGVDGFEILAELAGMPPSVRGIPVVILTAHQHFEYLHRAYPNVHIVAHMSKPCRVDEMRTLLSRTCRGKSAPTTH